MLDAALAYAARGWPVFACGRDKKPLTARGVLDATTNVARITAMWANHPDANIAFHPGGIDWMVLDDDPGYDGKSSGKYSCSISVISVERSVRERSVRLGFTDCENALALNSG